MPWHEGLYGHGGGSGGPSCRGVNGMEGIVMRQMIEQMQFFSAPLNLQWEGHHSAILDGVEHRAAGCEFGGSLDCHVVEGLSNLGELPHTLLELVVRQAGFEPGSVIPEVLHHMFSKFLVMIGTTVLSAREGAGYAVPVLLLLGGAEPIVQGHVSHFAAGIEDVPLFGRYTQGSETNTGFSTIS